jgi:hypothetical protein
MTQTKPAEEQSDLIYGAREESLKKVQQQAEAVDADDVLGGLIPPF